jgi:hypothetical protein
METTLNINAAVLAKITCSAKSAGISRSALILILMKRVMADISDTACMGSMVRYQEGGRSRDWRTFHLTLREDEYEFLLDLRKLMKMSVSRILAYAVKKYHRTTKRMFTDNYRFINYTILREIVDDIICLKFMWGFPRGIAKLLR